MGGEAMYDGEDEADAIAKEWGVEVDLLNSAHWELQSRDGHDGAHYGYFVSFDRGNDPAPLKALGLREGEYLREVSLNAFDRPDRDEDE
ncbi:MULTISPECIES: hypothetical protein [Bosea]|uniref:hypothetical protein n=1 Tax=Bosea TaxID=85413 RepID=UPI0021503474|nr:MULTISPECIES: hypothetical protein [Bosea]MCR4522659.1 hypothetical protein [Bosea sp. 47.2.35]MDR6827167.1 hypothetical protein [Bosea robiniae]MDR6893877.1 hypothetical protein [Bosea sp. BE109]MDR7136423.1 hypothetical protein [Bosea sp. BE168]MDR7173122.1 hypothetical protein [Bosea sp. BE271]